MVARVMVEGMGRDRRVRTRRRHLIEPRLCVNTQRAGSCLPSTQVPRSVSKPIHSLGFCLAGEWHDCVWPGGHLFTHSEGTSWAQLSSGHTAKCSPHMASVNVPITAERRIAVLSYPLLWVRKLRPRKADTLSKVADLRLKPSPPWLLHLCFNSCAVQTKCLLLSQIRPDPRTHKIIQPLSCGPTCQSQST